jgi:hypothetical protein
MRGAWSIDYPKADRQFVQGVRRLTRLNVRSVEQVVNLGSDDIMAAVAELRMIGMRANFFQDHPAARTFVAFGGSEYDGGAAHIGEPEGISGRLADHDLGSRGDGDLGEVDIVEELGVGFVFDTGWAFKGWRRFLPRTSLQAPVTTRRRSRSRVIFQENVIGPVGVAFSSAANGRCRAEAHGHASSMVKHEQPRDTRQRA